MLQHRIFLRFLNFCKEDDSYCFILEIYETFNVFILYLPHMLDPYVNKDENIPKYILRKVSLHT